MNIDKDTWHVINSYFDETPNYLTKHHIDSFNDFILNLLPSTFKIPFLNPHKIFVQDKKNPRIQYEMNIYYGGKEGKGIYMSKPTIYDALTQEMRPMFPNECRLKNLTYASNLFMDIEIDFTMRQDDKNLYQNIPHPVPQILKRKNMGRIPIMLRSKPCALYNVNSETLKQMGESEYEHGGYFIVDGMEKVIISQERKAENKLYILKSKDDNYDYSAHVKSYPKQSFQYAKTTYVHMLTKTKSIAVAVTYLKKGNKTFDIPLFTFFRALGIESDEEILKYILYEFDSDKAQYFMELLRPSMEESEQLGVYDQLSALTFLEKFPDKVSDDLERGGGEMKRNREARLSFLYDAMYKSLFPHVGDSFTKKAYYLGYVVNELLHVATGLKKETDRDSWRYKRIDLSGFLLANLFREKVMKLSWHVRTQVETKYEFGHSDFSGENFIHIINEVNINEFFDYKIIENGFKDAFKIGEITKKKGLIQSVQRVGSNWMTSYLRRINTPNDLGGRIPFEQRMTHGTQYGMFCSAEYPSGGAVAGLKKHLTMVSHVTFGSNGLKLEECVRKLGLLNVEDLHPNQTAGKTKVFINGDWVGVHEDPTKLVSILRNMRRNGLINVYTSIAWRIQDMEIHCYTDGGRACFPLYVIENNKHLLTPEHVEGLRSGKYSWTQMISGFKKKKTGFDYFLDYLDPAEEGFDVSNLEDDLIKHRGIVEYLDTEEVDTCLFSPSLNIPNNKFKRFTHCELHPSLNFGVLGSTLPFPNYGQAPRNVYATGQNKQAVSYHIDNYRNRMETANLLYNGQKPLVGTRLRKYINTDTLPSGHNVIVAIACYSGYNQEDSVIINLSSLQRGLFLSTYYKTYQKSEIKDVKKGSEEVFYNRNRMEQTNLEEMQFSQKYRGYTLDHLDEYGFVKEGTYLTGKEILIGAYSRIKTKDGKTEIVDVSVPTKTSDALVDKVFTCYTNNDRHRMCKIRTAQERVPEFGDKFASRHGQKGTIGMRFLSEDMPFTQSGITPDIIINPHAIPSRMTIGQLIECIYAKSCAELGFLGDATAFNYVDNQNLADVLENKCGFHRQGDEILYNGMTGEQFKSLIFIGPTYYQRLKHMVRDKINARSSGSRYGPFQLPSQGGGYSARERQPPGGRALDGGLRIGEMERDCVLAYGMQGFLKESMMERSDKFSCFVCNTSGRLAVANQFDHIYYSPDIDGPATYHINETAGTDISKKNDDPNSYHKMVGLNVFHQKATNFSQIHVPYTFKMLIHELESIGLSMRLISEDNVHNFNQLPIDSKLTYFNEDIDELKTLSSSMTLESLTQEEDDEKDEDTIEDNSEDSSELLRSQELAEIDSDDSDEEESDDEEKPEPEPKRKKKNTKVSKSKKSVKEISKELEPPSGDDDKKDDDKKDDDKKDDDKKDDDKNDDKKDDDKKDDDKKDDDKKDDDKKDDDKKDDDKKDDDKKDDDKKDDDKKDDKSEEQKGGGKIKLEIEPSLDQFISIGTERGGGSHISLNNMDFKPSSGAKAIAQEVSNFNEVLPSLANGVADSVPMNNVVSMSEKVIANTKQAGGERDGDVKVIRLKEDPHNTSVMPEADTQIQPFNLNQFGGRRKRRAQSPSRNQYGGFDNVEDNGEETILNEVFLG